MAKTTSAGWSPRRTPAWAKVHLSLPRIWKREPQCQSARAERQPPQTPCLANAVSPLVMVLDKVSAAASDTPNLANSASRYSNVNKGPNAISGNTL